MAAVPKRKISHSHGRHRRAQTFKAPLLPVLGTCPECGEPVRPYHVCLNCGTYRRSKVMQGKQDEKKS